MTNDLLVLIFGGANDNTVTEIQLRPNPSMQVGDTVYKVSSPSSTGGVTTADVAGSSTLQKLGTIKQIRDWNDKNGTSSTNYSLIGGDQDTGEALYIYPIDLDGDGDPEGYGAGTYFPAGGFSNGYGSYAIVIENPTYIGDTPTINDYFFFSKDNGVNLTSITGYYAEVEFKNNSTEKAELFATACEITESSK